MDVLISIKPCYVDKICNGLKHYEYRRRVFAQDVERVYVYSSSPVKKIIGYFDYVDTISADQDELWNRTCEYAGISFEAYKSYFEGCELANALVIKQFHEFTKGIVPTDIFDKFTPPQSYLYIREGQAYEKLRNMV